MSGWSWLLKHSRQAALPEVSSTRGAVRELSKPPAPLPIALPKPAAPLPTALPKPAVPLPTANPSEAEISEGWNLAPSGSGAALESRSEQTPERGTAEGPPTPNPATMRSSERPPLARLRRHLVVVSGGCVKRAEPGEFVDWVTARVALSETHPVLALLLVSFSSEIDTRVQWRLVLGAEPHAVPLGRPIPCKVTAGKPRSVTVYGVTPPLPPGEYQLRAQVSTSAPASIAVHPSASAGAEYLRFLIFELL